MKGTDVSRIESSIKILKAEHEKLEALKDEWTDKISELEEKDTDKAADEASMLQESNDSLEEVTIALNEAIDNLKGLRDR